MSNQSEDAETFRLTMDVENENSHTFRAEDGTVWLISANKTDVEVRRKNNVHFLHRVKLQFILLQFQNIRIECTKRFWHGDTAHIVQSFGYEVSLVSNRHFNNLTMTCEFTAITIQNNDSLHIRSYSYEDCLSSYFQNLLTSGLFSDVTLICGNLQIKAHKCILAARSIVFAKMFETPMKESLEDKVEIPDIDVSTMEYLLSFIYTGEIKGLPGLAYNKTREVNYSVLISLYASADKYAILNLKNRCAHDLKQKMNVNNVMHILKMADIYSDQELKSSAVKFINAKWDKVKASKLWKSFLLENRELFLEIISEIQRY